MMYTTFNICNLKKKRLIQNCIKNHYDGNLKSETIKIAVYNATKRLLKSEINTPQKIKIY